MNQELPQTLAYLPCYSISFIGVNILTDYANIDLHLSVSLRLTTSMFSNYDPRAICALLSLSIWPAKIEEMILIVSKP